MSSLNQVNLIGNLGQDPEIRTMNNGDKVVSFSVATSETWRDKNTNERKEKTEWHRVVIFNQGLIKIAEQYLKKGHKIYLSGSLGTRKWTDQAGVERYSTEVVLKAFRGELVLLGGGTGSGRGADSPDDYGADTVRGTDATGRSTEPFPLDDEIPF